MDQEKQATLHRPFLHQIALGFCLRKGLGGRSPVTLFDDDMGEVISHLTMLTLQRTVVSGFQKPDCLLL